MPYAFTEQGVAMLSSVLRSQIAIDVNIQIMRAFVSMRHFMTDNISVFNRLETMEYIQLEMQKHQSETDKRIAEVFRRLGESSKSAVNSSSTLTAITPNILPSR